MIRIEFHELAEKELLDSRDYYDDLVFGLGRKFVSEVEFIIQRINDKPLAFPLYYKDYRVALLRKFPFSLIYKLEKERIYILAVAHQKRKPKFWVSRT